MDNMFKKLHSAFICEGRMIAMPLCFPGVSTPIDANDSYINSLTLSADGIIYGTTNGRHSHVFVVYTKGPTGVIVDLWEFDENLTCIASVCLEDRIITAANTGKGSRLLSRPVPRLPFDCIQEWSFDSIQLESVLELDCRITDMISCGAGDGILVTTDKGVFHWCPGEDKVKWLDTTISGNISVDRQQNIYIIAPGGDVCFIEQSEDGFNILRSGSVPGRLGEKPVVCADSKTASLYLVDLDGIVYRIQHSGEIEKVFQTDIIPVTCMSTTNDGRLFGFYGDKVAKMFEYDPGSEKSKCLGCAVSVFNRRRYGYEFSCAVTGEDGEIFFGEHDRGGHLWIFYPAIKP